MTLYTTGTISVSGNTVTGIGTGWAADILEPHDRIVAVVGGNPVPLTVDARISETEARIAFSYSGNPVISNASYYIEQTSPTSRIITLSDRVATLLESLGLTPEGNPIDTVTEAELQSVIASINNLTSQANALTDQVNGILTTPFEPEVNPTSIFTFDGQNKAYRGYAYYWNGTRYALVTSSAQIVQNIGLLVSGAGDVLYIRTGPSAYGPFVPTIGTETAPTTQAYARSGFAPELVAAFSDNFFASGGAATTTASLISAITRASTATYTDQSGATQTAAANDLRFGNHEYDAANARWVNKGLLFEPAATNLCPYSDDLTQASLKDVAPPSGKTVTTINGNGQPRIGYSCTTAGGAITNAALFARRNHRYVQCYDFIGPGLRGNYVNFDLLTGLVTAQGSNGSGYMVPRGMDSNGNAQWRPVATFGTESGMIPAGNIRWGFIGEPTAGHGDTFLGDGLNQFDISQMCTFDGTKVFSYFPTNGAAGVRAADPAGAVIASGLLPDVTGTISLLVKGDMNIDANTDAEILRLELNSSTYLAVSLDTSAGTGRIVVTQSVGGIVDTVPTAASAFASGPNTPFSIAITARDNFLEVASGGVSLTPNGTGVILDDLTGATLRLGGSFHGHIDRFVLWGGADITPAGREAASFLAAPPVPVVPETITDLTATTDQNGQVTLSHSKTDAADSYVITFFNGDVLQTITGTGNPTQFVHDGLGAGVSLDYTWTRIKGGLPSVASNEVTGVTADAPAIAGNFVVIEERDGEVEFGWDPIDPRGNSLIDQTVFAEVTS